MHIDHTSPTTSDLFGISLVKTNSFSASNINNFYQKFTFKNISQELSSFFIDERLLFFTKLNLTVENFALELGLLNDYNIYDLKDKLIFPQVSFNFILSENTNHLLKLKLAATASINSNNNDFGISLSLPYTYKNNSLSLGFAFSQNDLTYAKYLNGYKLERTSGNSLSLYLNNLLNFKENYLITDILIPYNLDTQELNYDDIYTNLEFATKINNLDLSFGFRAAGIFENFDKALHEDSELFISLGYSNVALSFKNKIAFSKNLIPEISFISTINSFDALIAKDNRNNKNITFYLTTGYDHSDNSDIIINPSIKIGKTNQAIFKLPFNLTIDGDKVFAFPDFKLHLAKSTREILLYSLADVSQFVDKISMGNQKNGAYFIIDRNQTYSNSLFSFFNSYNARSTLSLNLGFNLDNNVGFDFFVDNLELPRLLSFSYNIAPISGNNPIITMLLTSEFKFKNDRFDLLGVFNVSLKAKILDEMLESNFYFSSYFNYKDNNFDLYTFRDNSEYSTGVKFKFINDNYSIPFSLGVNKGKMRSYAFDAFSYVYFTTILDNKSLDEDMFLSLGYEKDFNKLELSTNYEIHNLLSLEEGIQDRYYLSLLYTINDFDMSLNFIKNNFITSLGKYKDFNSYLLNKDTIISLRLDKEFEFLAWHLECSTSPGYQLDNQYINMLKLDNTWDFSISLYTSLRF